MNRILVIVVTWNSARWLDRCLGSLRSSTVRVDALVVDNASTDGSADYIAQHFPEVELVRSEENMGFGAANNIGLKLALERGYDYVYLLNSDAWLLPDTLENMLAGAEGALSEGGRGDGAKGSRPFGILSPVQMDATLEAMDRRFEAKCGKALAAAEATVWTKKAENVHTPGGDDANVDDNSQKRPHSGRAVVPARFVMAAHWLISREALETVGGFSPVFKLYGEDDNYIERLRYHGFRCGVVPGAMAVHDRAGRAETKERRMKLKCISAVVKLSNPCAPLLWKMIWEPLELIGMSVKNASAEPLKFLPGFLKRYPEIIRIRRKSKKGALSYSI